MEPPTVVALSEFKQITDLKKKTIHIQSMMNVLTAVKTKKMKTYLHILTLTKTKFGLSDEKENHHPHYH